MTRWMSTRTVAGVSVAAVALALAVLLSRGAPTSVPEPSATAPSPSEPALERLPTTSGTPVHFRALLGPWLRPDGGYVLDVRAVASDGEARVAYFNPRPIRVAHAEARREGELVGLFVEFDDHNYRGSTYALGYDAASDQLRGTYFQATLGQRFDVFFVRQR